MAENLDPEIVFQFQEAMKEATDAAKAMPMAMNAMVDAINKAANPIKNNTKEINENTDALEDNTDAAEIRTKKDEAAAKATEERNKADILLKVASNDARTALRGFAEALLSGERGFSKYNQALGNAGNAAQAFGNALGPVGKILGGIVKGATMAASAMMKQADDVLKATDQLSKMGSAGAFSAEEVRRLGTGLGLASDQLDKFIKPVSSLGSSLISLGGNAAAGVVEFQKLAKELQSSRQEYQRLGISQEELIQNTADYINLQTMQGRQITERMKTDGSLRNAAREYTDNLLQLAALTGKDIEAVKKKNELAMAEIETAIQNNVEQQEINRLRKLDTAESNARANQLEAERKARDKLLQRVENEVGDPALRKGLAKFLATGAITQEVTALKLIGVPIEDFAAKIKQGIDVQDDFMGSLTKNTDRTVKNVDMSLRLNEDVRKAFGTSIEILQFAARTRDRDNQSQTDVIKERIKRIKDEKEAQDPAQAARNRLTEAEIAAKVALDDLVASANPLLKNFDEMSSTIQDIIKAVVVATAALTLMAAAAAGKAASDRIGNLSTRVAAAGLPGTGGIVPAAAGTAAAGTAAAGTAAAGTAAAGAGGLGAMLKGGARALGKFVAPLAIGMAGYDAFQGFRADKDAPLSERLKNAGSSALSGLSFGLLGSSAREIRNRKDENIPVAREQEKAIDAREKYALEQQLLDRRLSDAEKQLAARKLRQIEKEEALLLNQEAKLEFENATDELEKEAARQKSDRARRTIAQADMAMAVQKLEAEKDEEKRKIILEELIAARKKLADVEIGRANQILRDSANEEERKAAQERIARARKEFEEERDALRNEATPQEQQTTTAATVAASAPRVTGRGPPTMQDLGFDGGRAKGGPIAAGKFALVGEQGPEFVSGPSQITNMNQMIESIKGNISFSPLHKESEELQETFTEVDTNVKNFSKELNTFVRDDSANKLAKQLSLVTSALEDFQELIDPKASMISISGAGGMGGAGGGAGQTGGILGSIMSMIGSATSAFGGRRGSTGGRRRGPENYSSGGGSSDDSSFGDSGAEYGVAPGPDGKLLDFIGKLESNGNYNILVGGKTQSNPSLTEMTIGQILEFQRGMIARGHESTAVGKYQIIRRTLEGLVRRGVVSLQDKFDQSTQDKAALGLLDVRKRQDFQNRKIDAETYANNLAHEWASLPMPDGRSAYAGVGSNKAHASRHEFMTAIQAKTGGVSQGPESGYLATLHGNEIIVPIDPNSILVELGKKSSAQIVSEMEKKTQNTTNMYDDSSLKEIVAANKFMAELLSNKLDNMITQLEISNDTQDKLLKFSQI